MVEEIKIHSLSTNLVLTLNRTDSMYLLDDNSPDWGAVASSDVTYPLLSSGIGVGLTKTSLNQARAITIVVWVYKDSFGTVESKKAFLNTFCNPFDELEIVSGDYKIKGHFSQPVVYPGTYSLNNECVCKCLLYITCPFPLFQGLYQNKITNRGELINNFKFPLVLPKSQSFVFGYTVPTREITINNKGTIPTGMVIDIQSSNIVQGISICLNEQVFKLSPAFSLSPGDVVKINTVAGQRGIWLRTESQEFQPALELFDLNSDWIQAPIGFSTIYLTCDTGSVSYLNVDIHMDELFYAMEEQ